MRLEVTSWCPTIPNLQQSSSRVYAHTLRSPRRPPRFGPKFTSVRYNRIYSNELTQEDGGAFGTSDKATSYSGATSYIIFAAGCFTRWAF
jgi:hypothetical protein